MDPKMKAVARFVATAFCLFIAWFIFHDFYLTKHTKFVSNLILVETNTSVALLNMVEPAHFYTPAEQVIYRDGKRVIIIGEECSALILFALFAGFIICFPGNSKNKYWYIPLGIGVIFLLNIIRIVILVLNFLYFRSSFAFNHHVTFTYLVYAVIFVLWIIWVNKFSLIRNKSAV